MDKSINVAPRTVHDEISFIRARLHRLVGHFNEQESWDAALKAQVALVAVHEIFGSEDADYETSYAL